MYLHTIILTLFRPFLQGPQRLQKLRVFTSADSSPGAIYEASINQMKHIVLQHHLDYPDKLFSSFAYTGYMQLCSAMAGSGAPDLTSGMRGPPSQRREERFYFDVCMCFLQDAYLQHALAMPIAQGLLTMALESRLIPASKARKILQGLEERGAHHHQASLSHTKEAWQVIVNFELSVVDSDASRAHVLASKLEDLVLFDEFMNTTTTATDDEDQDCRDEYENIYGIDNYNEHDYDSSAPSGSVVSPGLYRTPASEG